MLINLLVSLSPLAVYLFIMASLNRRDRPIILTGIEETLGLFLAFSGFLLYTGPQLLRRLYGAELSMVPLDEEGSPFFEDVWQKWFLVWIAYYLVLALLAGMLLILRRNVRSIFNVDLDQFRNSLFRTIEEEGLTARQGQNSLHLFPASAIPSDPSIFPLASLSLDAFPALCHVTLRWDSVPMDLQERFDASLERNLEEAVALDNPTANWLLGFASLLFGALIMILAMLVFSRFLPRRGI